MRMFYMCTHMGLTFVLHVRVFNMCGPTVYLKVLCVYVLHGRSLSTCACVIMHAGSLYTCAICTSIFWILCVCSIHACYFMHLRIIYMCVCCLHVHVLYSCACVLYVCACAVWWSYIIMRKLNMVAMLNCPHHHHNLMTIAIYIMAINSGFFPARGPEGLFF